MNNEKIVSELYEAVEKYVRKASDIYQDAVTEAKASVGAGEVMPASFPVGTLPCSGVIRELRDEAEAEIAAFRDEVAASVADQKAAVMSDDEARTLDVLLAREAVTQDEIDAYANKFKYCYPFIAGLREVAAKCGANPPAPHAAERTMEAFDWAAKRCRSVIEADSTLSGGGDMSFLRGDMANRFDGYRSFMGKRLEPLW